MTVSPINVQLPHPAEPLVPHRPPMLLVERVLERHGNHALVEGRVPDGGLFLSPAQEVLPEYCIEAAAQAMAAVSGFDALAAGRYLRGGFLVGVEDFVWIAQPTPGGRIHIALEKTFSFGAVTIVRCQLSEGTTEIANGALKVWEETA